MARSTFAPRENALRGTEPHMFSRWEGRQRYRNLIKIPAGADRPKEWNRDLLQAGPSALLRQRPSAGMLLTPLRAGPAHVIGLGPIPDLMATLPRLQERQN